MLTLLHLLSAVALLVWGTHIVRTGVMRVFGARLRTVLSRSVEKKPLAFCAGIGVTALVQSSNATTMLVTSFVAQDLVALAPALVIVLGADVGTALMARILTFDLSWLSPLLIFIGVIFFLGRKQSRAGQLGRVGIGLGLILLALELIVQAVTPITQANGVQVIFASLTGDILLDALIGAMFAIISYSSLAAVLLTATLTAAGIISFPVALCLVIGANLGSGLLAMLNNSAARHQQVLFVVTQADKTEPCHEWDMAGIQPSPAQAQNIREKTEAVFRLFRPVHPVVAVSVRTGWEVDTLVSALMTALPDHAASPLMPDQAAEVKLCGLFRKKNATVASG